MKIAIGSRNPAKTAAVQDVFSEAEQFTYVEAPSGVSAQPLTDEETRTGAINRAMHCADATADVYGIGLEGGVMQLADGLYLCNWGALAAPNGDVVTASGARILLPREIALELEKGAELGDVMDQYAQKKDVRKKEGAIGIFTNDIVSRKEMFVHVVKLLRGQWEFNRMVHPK